MIWRLIWFNQKDSSVEGTVDSKSTDASWTLCCVYSTMFKSLPLGCPNFRSFVHTCIHLNGSGISVSSISKPSWILHLLVGLAAWTDFSAVPVVFGAGTHSPFLWLFRLHLPLTVLALCALRIQVGLDKAPTLACPSSCSVLAGQCHPSLLCALHRFFLIQMDLQIVCSLFTHISIIRRALGDSVRICSLLSILPLISCVSPFVVLFSS